MPDEVKDDTMHGLHEVKVKKTEMIAKLKVNRKKHKEDYEEAALLRDHIKKLE